MTRSADDALVREARPGLGAELMATIQAHTLALPVSNRIALANAIMRLLESRGLPAADKADAGRRAALEEIAELLRDGYRYWGSYPKAAGDFKKGADEFRGSLYGHVLGRIAALAAPAPAAASEGEREALARVLSETVSLSGTISSDGVIASDSDGNLRDVVDAILAAGFHR